MTNVFLTVLDLQMHNVVVIKAILHYRAYRWDDVRTLDDLERALDRAPDTREGNQAAAQYLWGNNHWTRIQWLRGFAQFLRRENLTSQKELREWAMACDFDADFKGRVKHLGIAACQWLRMRLGVDTVKPDVHTHRFVERAIGRRLSDPGLVQAVEEAAKQLGIGARVLDAAIWEAERGSPGTISAPWARPGTESRRPHRSARRLGSRIRVLRRPSGPQQGALVPAARLDGTRRIDALAGTLT